MESSAKRNKKAVQCTADFVISATFCEQVPTVADTTKATLSSGFLVALCARDSGGIRTHDPQLRRLLLYPAELRNHPFLWQTTPPFWLYCCGLMGCVARLRCKSKQNILIYKIFVTPQVQFYRLRCVSFRNRSLGLGRSAVVCRAVRSYLRPL